MSHVEIYTKSYCGYCQRAKKLLKRKGLSFYEYEITNDNIMRDEMIARSGRTTVPQVFIDGIHVGGGVDLAKANKSGELDLILGCVNDEFTYACAPS